MQWLLQSKEKVRKRNQEADPSQSHVPDPSPAKETDVVLALAPDQKIGTSDDDILHEAETETTVGVEAVIDVTDVGGILQEERIAKIEIGTAIDIEGLESQDHVPEDVVEISQINLGIGSDIR